MLCTIPFYKFLAVVLVEKELILEEKRLKMVILGIEKQEQVILKLLKYSNYKSLSVASTFFYASAPFVYFLGPSHNS